MHRTPQYRRGFKSSFMGAGSVIRNVGLNEMSFLSKLRNWLTIGGLPHKYRERQKSEAIWRDAFGDDSRLANEILLVFCDAFGFAMDERYKFTPDDRIVDVYTALYPPRWSMSDSLELETLVTSLQERFRLGVSRFDSGETVSFREVVSAVKKAQQAVCSEPRDGASISCRKSGSRGR